MFSQGSQRPPIVECTASVFDATGNALDFQCSVTNYVPNPNRICQPSGHNLLRYPSGTISGYVDDPACRIVTIDLSTLPSIPQPITSTLSLPTYRHNSSFSGAGQRADTSRTASLSQSQQSKEADYLQARQLLWDEQQRQQLIAQQQFARQKAAANQKMLKQQAALLQQRINVFNQANLMVVQMDSLLTQAETFLASVKNETQKLSLASIAGNLKEGRRILAEQTKLGMQGGHASIQIAEGIQKLLPTVQGGIINFKISLPEFEVENAIKESQQLTVNGRHASKPSILELQANLLEAQKIILAKKISLEADNAFSMLPLVQQNARKLRVAVTESELEAALNEAEEFQNAPKSEKHLAISKDLRNSLLEIRRTIDSQKPQLTDASKAETASRDIVGLIPAIRENTQKARVSFVETELGSVQQETKELLELVNYEGQLHLTNAMSANLLNITTSIASEKDKLQQGGEKAEIASLNIKSWLPALRELTRDSRIEFVQTELDAAIAEGQEWLEKAGDDVQAGAANTLFANLSAVNQLFDEQQRVAFQRDHGSEVGSGNIKGLIPLIRKARNEARVALTEAEMSATSAELEKLLRMANNQGHIDILNGFSSTLVDINNKIAAEKLKMDNGGKDADIASQNIAAWVTVVRDNLRNAAQHIGQTSPQTASVQYEIIMKPLKAAAGFMVGAGQKVIDITMGALDFLHQAEELVDDPRKITPELEARMARSGKEMVKAMSSPKETAIHVFEGVKQSLNDHLTELQRRWDAGEHFVAGEMAGRGAVDIGLSLQAGRLVLNGATKAIEGLARGASEFTSARTFRSPITFQYESHTNAIRLNSGIPGPSGRIKIEVPWTRKDVLSEKARLHPVPLLAHEEVIIEQWARERLIWLERLKTYDLSNVNPQMRKLIRKPFSQLRDHMTPDDLAAIFKEHRKVVIPKPGGGRYDHLNTEWRAAKQSFENVLNGPRTGSLEEAIILREQFGNISRLWDRFEKLIERAKCNPETTTLRP